MPKVEGNMTTAEALWDAIKLIHEHDMKGLLFRTNENTERVEQYKIALICHCAHACGAQMFTEDMVFYTRRYGPLMAMEFTGEWDDADPPNPIFLPWEISSRGHPPEGAMAIR